MPVGKRDLRNLPDPGALAVAPDLRDWLHRLYDILSELSSNQPSGSFVEHVYSDTTTRSIYSTDADTSFGAVYAPVSWEEGTAYRVRAAGALDTYAPDQQLTIRVRLGSVVLVEPTVTILSGSDTDGVSGATWQLDVVVVCRQAGSSGVLMATGTGFVAAGGLANALDDDATLSTDLTAGSEFEVWAEWAVSDVDNSIRMHSFNVERMPAP